MLLGLFGGTFDPPHLAHLALSRAALSSLQLDRLLWLLTPKPPHKRGRIITPLKHRLAMVQIAIKGEPFELSRLDIDRPAPHYALDTVRLLKEQNFSADILYLMGSDSLNDLPGWHKPSELVSALYAIGVMLRPGEIPELATLEEKLPGLSTKVRFVNAPELAISSSDVRQRVQRGENIDHLVPPGIADYIREHRLYRSSIQQ